MIEEFESRDGRSRAEVALAERDIRRQGRHHQTPPRRRLRRPTSAHCAEYGGLYRCIPRSESTKAGGGEEKEDEVVGDQLEAERFRTSRSRFLTKTTSLRSVSYSDWSCWLRF